MTAVTENITAGADDCQEVNGVFDGTNTEIKVGFYSGGVNSGGFRFAVTVPQGATINTATLTTTIFAVSGGSGSATVYADDVDDAAAWGSASKPSQITQTTENAAFAASATGADVVDVKSIMQKMVDRGGWVSDNNMRFAFIGSGTGYKQVRITAYERTSAPANPAVLAIDYTAGGGGGGGHGALLSNRRNRLVMTA